MMNYEYIALSAEQILKSVTRDEAKDFNLILSGTQFH